MLHALDFILMLLRDDCTVLNMGHSTWTYAELVSVSGILSLEHLQEISLVTGEQKLYQ